MRSYLPDNVVPATHKKTSATSGREREMMASKFGGEGRPAFRGGGIASIIGIVEEEVLDIGGVF